MINWFLSRWNVKVGLGAVLIAIVLCGFWAGIFALMRPAKSQVALEPAELMVIEAPTLTPSPSIQLTQTVEAALEVIDGISVGVSVQIAGTEGAGLRLRSGPGVSEDVRFIGLDAELFEVKDGPEEADGFVWWYLVSPYDEQRSGWAASNYLDLISTPQ